MSLREPIGDRGAPGGCAGDGDGVTSWRGGAAFSSSVASFKIFWYSVWLMTPFLSKRSKTRLSSAKASSVRGSITTNQSANAIRLITLYLPFVSFDKSVSVGD